MKGSLRDSKKRVGGGGGFETKMLQLVGLVIGQAREKSSISYLIYSVCACSDLRFNHFTPEASYLLVS